MGSLALLGLLAAAALAGVGTVPVEKDHMEEMITRCIVEVLSNALSKPNAPPINPECKEILKKGGKTDRERSEDKQLEVRHLKEPPEFENPHSESVEREQNQAEGDSKKHVKGSDEEKLHPGEGNSKEDEEGQRIPVREEKLHTEEKNLYQEIRREENSYHSEEESKESKQSDGEVDHAVLNKKSHSAGVSTEEVAEENDHPPMDHWHSEEGMQSPYKRIHEGEEEEAEEERSEKYHLNESKGRDFSQRNEHEESDENEEVEEEKKSYKPKRYHGKHRMGDSSEENRGRGGEKEELAEESNVEESHLWDKKNNHQKHHYEESEQQHEEKSGYRGRHGSEGMEEKRRVGQGSVEYRERWQQKEEKSQEENKRHHNSEESNEKWHEEWRHRSEGRAYRGDESEEELDRFHSDSSKEKQHHGGGRHRLWDDEGEGTLKEYTQEHKGQARTHHNTEDNVEQQHYPGNSDEEEEEVEKKHYSSDQIENEENMEQGYAEKEEYRSHLPAENEKRTTAPYSPLYPLLWWKSRHFEKRNSAGERLPESKEESRPTLSEKNLFPEYSDYDWWDKKQLLSALNRGRSEKRNLSKRNRYDMKRQYDKMDQLTQLLNYRKKSAEFLELYNSGEDMKKRHVIRNDKGTLSQRPLTEEEAKELENLAAMDLELQKIAETFNDNRRG
ncbi:secretogranin-1 isoform X3 [Lagopus leucura]|uniref:secretogranin-1 isoform X3 n=1 Tax=Lagopus leucura TaxID=30410 RepID=UPI001C682803|nr:secretogranin-1 isoform X3 [Lagopus leucura]